MNETLENMGKILQRNITFLDEIIQLQIPDFSYYFNP
jgi:hypothetical protein